MASEPGCGIEATDLASLLCRFEEATSPVTVLNGGVQKKKIKYRDHILRLKRNAAGNPVPPNQRSLLNKSTVSGETLPSSLNSLSNSTYVESKHHAGFDESSSAPPSVVSCETLPDSRIVLQKRSSNLPEKTECRNMVMSRNDTFSSALDNLESFFTENESLFQDAVSHQGSLANKDVLCDLKTELIEELLDLPVTNELTANNSLSALAVSDMDSHSDDSSISALLQRNDLFFGGGYTLLHDIIPDVKDSFFNVIAESSIDDLTFDLVSSEHAASDSNNLFCWLDHNYCSQTLPAPERAGGTLEKSLFTAFRNSEENALSNLVLSQYISDIKDDSCSISTLPGTDISFLDEEIEITIQPKDFDHQTSQLPDCEPCDNNFSSSETAVLTDDKEDSTTKQQNPLLHTESSAEPVCEVPGVFFDKIPSYYTALSISSKPLTTSVFASATKNIGSTDHLDLWDSKERADNSQYNKVPAHRHCFTNTSKEVKMKIDNSEKENVPKSDGFQGQDSENSSVQENVVIPCELAEIKNENCSAVDLVHPVKSHSPYSRTTGRCSRSPVRRSASTSRFSRHSASSSSDCSTCSSCSYVSDCSTCSPSRSPSLSDSDRGSPCSDYRRTRSRSPASRSNRFSERNMRYGLTSSEFRQSKSKAAGVDEESDWRSRQHRYRGKYKSPMDTKVLMKKRVKEEEQLKAMEERRVVYVGKIPDGYTKRQLYQRFQSFGEIKEVKVNFREHGDNYGFVTFAYSCDAVAAKERGNSMPGEVRFDLCFGGRRHFCPDQYADLDGNREIEEEYAPMPRNMSKELDYAALLKLHSSQRQNTVVK